MRNDIKELVNNIFKSAPDTQKAAELKEEIYQNLCDRYDDLTRGGKSDREAMQEISAVIGDFTPLIESLGSAPQSDADGGAAHGTASGSVPPVIPPQATDSATDNVAKSTAPQRKSGLSRTARGWIIAGSIIVGVILIMCGVAAAFVGISGFSGYNYDHYDMYTEGSEAVFDTSDIRKIDISWIGGSVAVETGEPGSQISISEKTNDSFDGEMRYRVSGDTLYIRFSHRLYWWTVFGGGSWGLIKDLTVTLPADYSAEDIDIETVSADIRIGGDGAVNCGGFDIESVSGSVYLGGSSQTTGASVSVETVSGGITLNKCSGENIDLKAVSGKIDVSECVFADASFSSVSGRISYEGELKYLDCETVSGSVDINVTALESLDAQSVSANITVMLYDTDDIKVSMDSVSGDFLYRSFEMSLRNGDYISGDGHRAFDFESVSGNLSVIKKEVPAD